MTKEDNRKIKPCRRDYAFAAISVVSGILWVSLVLFGSFNLGFTIANLFFLVTGSIYLRLKGKKAGILGWTLIVLSAAGSIVFTLTANGFTKFLLFLLLCISQASCFRIFTVGAKHLGDLKLPFIAVYTIFVPTFDNIVGAVRLLFSGVTKDTAKYKKIFGGVLLALPVLFVVVPLLINSDAAFEGLMKSLGGDVFLWIMKIALGLVIAPFIYTYFFANRYFGGNYKINKKLKPVADSLWGVSFLGAISLCYCLYLFSQLAYIFGGLSGILPENYTMAEYARRGFFEIAIISGINFTLIYGSLLICKRNKIFCTLQIFVCVFTMFLIVTAEAKMVMYISRFGMTTLRILTSTFLLFLFVMGVVLILRCLSAKITIIRPALMTALILTILIGGVGTGRIVATYNAEAYMCGKLKTVDVNTIGDCGAASIGQLIKLEKHLKNSEDYTVYNQVMDELIDKFYHTYVLKSSVKFVPKEKSGIGNYNLEVNHAQRDFDDFIESDPEFVQKALWCRSAENSTQFYDNALYLEYKILLEIGLVGPIEPPEFAMAKK